MLQISPETIRKLAVYKQRLSGPQPSPDMDGLIATLRDIRCLQIDPIRAVERTQYLVLFSRLGCYSPELLDKAAYEDRFLFEYWAHAASYVLTEDFEIHHYRMVNAENRTSAWGKRIQAWVEENRGFESYMLKTIKDSGPKRISDLDDGENDNRKSGVWSSNRNAQLMVNALWDRGELLVSRRSGLKKYWDLAERVLPDWTPQELLPANEVTSQAAQLSVKGLGAGTLRHIKNHFTRARYPNLENVLEQLVREGKLVQAEVLAPESQWHTSGPWYVHADDLQVIEAIENGSWQPRTTLLSPFDNLIADRERTELLWNFYFRIEIYVPAKKREYGYYVLPILHGDSLIGRIDPKMDRKTGILHVQAVYREADSPTDTETVRAVRSAIDELAHFLGAKSVEFTDKIPAEWKEIVNDEIV